MLGYSEAQKRIGEWNEETQRAVAAQKQRETEKENYIPYRRNFMHEMMENERHEKWKKSVGF